MKKSNDQAVAYVRVSTKRQDEEGYSPESQHEAITAYAKKGGLTIRRWFEEAASGYKLNARTEYYQMLSFVMKEKISHVIYKFADRVARNLPDFVALEKLGVHLHNLERGKSFNPSDPDDYQETADEERRIISAKEETARSRKRMMDSVRLMVTKGDYPGAIPPLGYWRNPLKKIGKRKRAGQIEIDKVRGPLIKKMFQLYSTGDYDYRFLAKKMYALGLRSRRDNFVNHSRIEDYLSNPFYCGCFNWEGKLSSSNESYAPLLTKELWEEVQNIKAERSRQTRTNYAGNICKSFKYHGLKCSLCGCAIVGEERHKTLRKSGKVVSYVYYHCCQAKGKCALDWFKEEELDRYFGYAFGDLEELTLTPDIYEKARKKLEEDYNDNRTLAQEELAAQRKELAKIDSQSQTLNRHLISGTIQPDAYSEMRDSLSSQKADVESRIAELEQAEEVFVDFACESLKLITDFKIKYLSGNQNFRKKLNTLLFKTISLTPKREPSKKGINLRCLQLEWNEPFATLFENYKKWFLKQEELEEEYFRQEKKFGGADET
ncbi:MAG: recombinase family protein [Candidatus Aminicenantes bacterium]|nr:recombinase family protein [Candidatus Aminicenantes bacterium]